MSDRRQLAVIMFADMVGYTALMQHNETGALRLLNRFKEELTLTIKECQGNIIQFYGDGCLSVFTNAADAVSCATILQEQFREDPPVPVRIGIHLGDVLYKDGNIFGDCVNITSRIESMSIAGAVLLSDAVKKQISNKPEFQLTPMGEFEFKNVDEPMEIFALSNKGFQVPKRGQLTGKLKEQKAPKSIAVLPFVNISNDPEQEYFSDGMAEEILNSLTHIEELKVAGRISSFQFKGKNVPLKEVGEKLGVKTVLEGSVRKQGNRVRITTRLINLEDGYQLWSEKFDREITDIFAIQEEIALSITEALKVTLLRGDRDLMIKSYTPNTQAYELYLKGRFYLNKRGAALFTALSYFQEAIALDPRFALAYVGYADSNLFLTTFGLVAPGQVLPQAKQSAEKAILLDPTLCESYCSLGYYYACYEWNWAEAEKNFLTSIQLNPRYCHSHPWYLWTFLSQIKGKFETAVNLSQKAIKQEPVSATLYGSYALILNTAGKLQEALAATEAGIELDAYSFLCNLNKGTICMELRRFEESISAFTLVANISKRHSFAVNGLIWNYCQTGDFEKATLLMDELKERSKTEYIPKMFMGISAAYLKNPDEAFLIFEKAYEERDPMLLTLNSQKWGPEEFINDPRLKKFIDRIGFPDLETSVKSGE